MPHASIRTRLILTLAVILTLAFTLTSYVNYRVAKSAVRAEIVHGSLPLTRDTIYSEIEKDLIRPIYVSSLMANDAFLKDWCAKGETDENEVTRYLEEIRKEYGFFSTFFVSAPSRKYYTPKGVLKRISEADAHDVWFFRFLASHAKYDIEVDANQAAGDALTVFINHRVTDGEAVLGVAGVGLELTFVSKLLSDYQEKYHREIYLVDQGGLVTVGGDSAVKPGTSIYALPGMREVAADVLRARDAPRDFELDRNGQHVFLTARYLPELRWFLVVEQDEGRSLEAARGSVIRTMGAGLAATVLVIVVCLVTVNIYHSRLERLASTDSLTGAANRRAFEISFKEALRQRQTRGTDLSLIMFDIDDFKSLNDRLGHLAGDAVLRAAADAARSCVRPEDVLARWGGDEFLILTMTGLTRAREMASRIADRIAALDMARPESHAPAPKVRISHGAAAYRDGDSLDDLTARADAAMYADKSRKGSRKETSAAS